VFGPRSGHLAYKVSKPIWGMCHPTPACHTSIGTKSTLKRKRSNSIVLGYSFLSLLTEREAAAPMMLAGGEYAVDESPARP
jgi:hypothetical protein